MHPSLTEERAMHPEPATGMLVANVGVVNHECSQSCACLAAVSHTCKTNCNLRSVEALSAVSSRCDNISWAVLQEYIALRLAHASPAATTGLSSPVQRRVTPVKQLGSAPSAMAVQLSSPPGGPKQATNSRAEGSRAEGSRAEQQHAEHVVLNQLKEVPMKAVNALLLVQPLLDHGMFFRQEETRLLHQMQYSMQHLMLHSNAIVF